MPLRILHVTPYAEGAWAYGGIPRVVTSLARALARAGHDVTIATTDAATATGRLTPPDGRRLRAWPLQRSADGFTTAVFPNISNHLAYRWQAFTPVGLNRFLAAHAGDFDVAHLHACRNLPGVLAAHHLWRAGVPYVLAPNGTAGRIERRLLAKQAFDWVAGDRVLRRAARVLAVSRAEVRQLVSLGVSPDVIRLIPNPVELDHGGKPAARGRFRSGLGLGDAPLVLFLGQLTPRKRVDVLIDAFAGLGNPGARLVVAGNDMGAGPGLRARAATRRVGDKTIFTGLLTGQDRLDALADADVVVYPSEHEAFGLVPLEALLVGTPVVVSDDWGCGEVITDTGGGELVAVGDVAGLRDAIAGVLAEPDARRGRAAEAAARVRELYEPGQVAGRLGNLYAEISGIRSAAAEGAGVSFVVPVRNGSRWIRETVAAIEAETDGRTFEIIAVDDGSDDESPIILRELAAHGRLVVVRGPGRGAAAAINAGIRAARFPLIAQVDQDVLIEPGWLDRLTAALEDPWVAAAQGRYVSGANGGFFERVMALDLAHRYAAIRGRATDHVCTGNAVYRASALHQVGLLDESLGYGYDNDLSYRLQEAGYRLAFCRAATSVHRWRNSLAGYCRQQYGFGYGRLEVVRRHPARLLGDRVSPTRMMLHPVVMTTALVLLLASGWVAGGGGEGRGPALLSAALLVALVVERSVAGIAATWRFGGAAGLGFPVAHLLRDVVWVTALAGWTAHWLAGRVPRPADSMQPRRAADGRDAEFRSAAGRSARPAGQPVPRQVSPLPPGQELP